jgi:hypothetical protein
MHVEFDIPVQAVVVEHTTMGRGTGNSQIGIGPMTFTCPIPLPPANEDGLIFTKGAPAEASASQKVTYTFNIYNTNCNPKPVNFSDVLEDGMVWVEDGLSLDETILNDAIVNDYAGTRELNIDSLVVPASSKLTFRATAKFTDPSAVVAKVYENQALLKYKRIKKNQETDVTWLSCDMNTLGCTATKVQVKPASNNSNNAVVTGFTVDSDCYKEQETYNVTLTVNNPNTYDVEDCYLDFNFNEEFAYVPKSLNAMPALGLKNATIDDADEGVLMIEGFKLASGLNTLEFKVKAPKKSGLIQATDANEKLLSNPDRSPMWLPLEISFDLSDDSGSIEADGSVEIPYCFVPNAHGCIISNKNVTSRIDR